MTDEKEKKNKKKKECQEGDNCHCHEKEIKTLKEKLASFQETVTKMTQENQELQNKVLTAQADNVNYRKRKDEETSNLLKFANQDLICDLLPILDNFERAIRFDDNNLSDELSKFLQGFKMIYAHFNEILKKYDVEEIDALEKEFDPTCEEALLVDHDQEKDDNIVLDVLMKGYRLKGRVIRPAKVKVNSLENEEVEKEEKQEKEND